MIYLASPYTYDNPEVERERFIKACQVAGIMIRQGYHVFSPIAHTHSIREAVSLPDNFAFYRDLNLHMIDFCSGFFVLQMDGWMSSVGVQAELDYLQKNHPAIKPQHVLVSRTINAGVPVFA